MVKTTDALGSEALFEYNLMGGMTKMTLTRSDGTTSQPEVTLYQYNKKNQLISETNPLTYAKSYTYDSNGNMTAVIDESGAETDYTFDLLNQMTGTSYADDKQALYAYDKNGKLPVCRY